MDKNKNVQKGIIERWKIDCEIINSSNIKSIYPQCFKCKYRIVGEFAHCEKYDKAEKEEYILNAQKVCDFFEPLNKLELGTLNKTQNHQMGALFAFVVGDALGVPVEFKNRENLRSDAVTGMRAFGTHWQDFGTWSDDTSLMLALMDAFDGKVSMSKLADNFVAYYRDAKFTPHDVMFDIGNATKAAIINIENGVPYDKCGGTSEGDNGNGSLMRILPMGLTWEIFGDDESIKLIEEISALTHAHKRSKLACIFYSHFIHLLLESKDKEKSLDNTIEFVLNNCRDEYEEEFEKYERIFSKKILKLKESDIKSSGYVVDSLEAAIWSFMREENTKDILLTAVNLGDDTDTIGALAGGLAGAYYGFSSIPNNWIQILVKKEELAEAFEKFLELVK